jgi:hypothetical protein
MNRTYLSLKYPVHRILGIFMYFYKDNNIVAAIDIRDDQIIAHYED